MILPNRNFDYFYQTNHKKHKFHRKEISQINFLKEEIYFNNIQSQLEKPQLKEKTQNLLQHIQLTIFFDLPHAF